MPAQSSVIINDGAATPVAHTFTPNGVLSNGQNQTLHSVNGEWLDRSPGFAVGYNRLDEQFKEANGNGVRKVRFVLTLPVLETVSGGTDAGFAPKPTVGYTNTVVIEFWASDRSSAQDLLHLYAYGKNLAAHAHVKTTVESFERPW